MPDHMEFVINDANPGAVGLEVVLVGLPHVDDGMSDEHGPLWTEPLPELFEIFLLALFHQAN